MEISRRQVLGVGLKVVLGVLLGLAVAFPEWERFADKAMDVRAFAYPVAVMVVPAIWVVRGRRGAFPWDVDVLLTLPFVVDVAGNAADLYDRVEWFDDACHYGNWLLLSAAVGVALRRWATLPSWVVGLSCAGAGAIAAIVWELFEYGVFILDTPESVTIYRDTIGDLTLGLLGATTAGLIAAFARTSGRRSVPAAPDTTAQEPGVSPPV